MQSLRVPQGEKKDEEQRVYLDFAQFPQCKKMEVNDKGTMSFSGIVKRDSVDDEDEEEKDEKEEKDIKKDVEVTTVKFNQSARM
jgi:hypothetical protein